MAPTRHNPNGLADGMIVRKVPSPNKVFRVRGNPDAGGATFVALTKGERTVLNGNARNYRPETDAEAYERIDAPNGPVSPQASDRPDDAPRFEDESGDIENSEPSVDSEASDQQPEPELSRRRRSLHAVESYPEPDIVELCDRMRDAVALIDDDTCSPADAAAIVRAAAELNWAVSTGQ
ncbi:hypothetical protein [Rhodococcus sp. P1Y]|uniref:hypothetical protein n=1 Tax=Rhodococcus sp. P1Y TaxID=1302308 RepID=UPI000EB47ABC|nr:hypothetical protein [Rhodococcus sp. P1Y]AYJ48021.1 hypothetical protein D8W71_06380 [Rhodococcus sp. P1Y]